VKANSSHIREATWLGSPPRFPNTISLILPITLQNLISTAGEKIVLGEAHVALYTKMRRIEKDCFFKILEKEGMFSGVLWKEGWDEGQPVSWVTLELNEGVDEASLFQS